ncbi:MAG: cytochrome c [Flavobacteriales bacterium]|nr:cytochrome c [Flavobacteriales bacterium]MCB9190231.1 cytochrome c [Flavobacteriales bacterium]
MNQVLLLIATVMLACGSVNSDNSDGNPGKEVYRTYCVACHGADGKLKLNEAPDLSRSEMTLEERINNISKGGSMMPAFAEVISEEQIQAVAVYLDELKEQD